MDLPFERPYVCVEAIVRMSPFLGSIVTIAEDGPTPASWLIAARAYCWYLRLIVVVTVKPPRRVASRPYSWISSDLT